VSDRGFGQVQIAADPADGFAAVLLIGVLFLSLAPTTAGASLIACGQFRAFLLETPTWYGPTNDSNWAFLMTDWDRDGRPDLVVLQRGGTSTGKTEVSILC
jgi:hypothetical protein